uniref:AAA domain-containing protein n=1 Tax=Candidatus Kentrum sp. FW TaxID=2126338 RepID=A0A450TQZ7_9GAMM|nr:MAG: hypothetical protein BECKFW1821B_GA0114236_11911 [Candidatus Kentron sp. FW]
MKSIPKEKVISCLAAENSWWESPYEIPSTFSVLQPRPYLELLFPLVNMTTPRRAVVLMGPRRVGKTVLVHHAIQRLLNIGVSPQRICYTSVDHPLYHGLGLEEILTSYMEITGIDYTKEECYLFFDEIQYLRDWELHLKAVVDRYHHCHCLASGSAAAALRLKSNESGAGRFTDFMLPPLTFQEYLALLGRSELVTIERSSDGLTENVSTEDIEQLNRNFLGYLNYGGYPEVALSKDIQQDPSRFIKNDIIDKVLLRDLPSLYGIQDVQELNHLFTTLAFNTGTEVSLESLAQSSGVAKNTIKRYIEYLEAAFLIRVVHRVDMSARRFKRANFFKVYLTNPSIHTALFSPVDDNDDIIGNLVETAIFSQSFHSNEHLYYARWNKGKVDMVHLGPDQKAIWAVEVKWSDRYFERPNELSALLRFCHAQNLTDGWVTSKTKHGIKPIESVSLRFLPASLYCYYLGHNIIQNRYALAGLGEDTRG